MLAAIDLTEADFYITNLVFCLPGNRTPSPEEVQVCQPFVERQIELLNPAILVFLGNAAAKQLTGATEGIMKIRGKWLTYGPGIRAMATLHPPTCCERHRQEARGGAICSPSARLWIKVPASTPRGEVLTRCSLTGLPRLRRTMQP